MVWFSSDHEYTSFNEKYGVFCTQYCKDVVKKEFSHILLFILILVLSFSMANAAERLCIVEYPDTFVVDTTFPSLKTDVVKITRSWDLPAILKNISAIDYYSQRKLACLQEEVGSIFIFNLDSGSIEREIPFGPPGDYQGLVLINNDAYVACADGRILEIIGYSSEKPEVKEYGTHLTVKENVNGLCYDRKNKRLLVTIKGTEDANQVFKSIYAFSLTAKSMPVKPALRIDLRNRVFIGMQSKNMQTVFQPSDLDISPVTGLLYIIDGTRAQLLRMKLSENIKSLIEFNKETIIQPEGITFTPSGELFIASKGIRDEPGMLFQVRLK